MRRTSWLGVLACAIGLSGCVSSTRPLGLPVWSEMQGVWQVDNDLYEVVLMPDGSMPMAWMEWDALEEQFTLSRGELVISVDEGVRYANIRNLDAPGGIFSFYRLLFLDSSTSGADLRVALIPPNENLFDRAIEEGLLHGEGTEVGPLVDDPRLAHFVDPLRFAEQFAVENPGSIMLAHRIRQFPRPYGEDTVLDQGQRAHMECLPESIAQRKRLRSDAVDTLRRMKSELEQALEQPVEMPDPTTEQWARFLNIDPQRWAGLMVPLRPSEQRFDFDNNGLAVSAKLSAADFSSYLTCLDSRGFGLVNVSDDEYAAFWVAKDGFGLFPFVVFMVFME